MTLSPREVPGFSDLTIDYLENFEKVKEFYAGDFKKQESFKEKIAQLKSKNYSRSELTIILRDQNLRFGCGQATLNHIELVKREDAYFVFAGQQVGIFSGPLYTIYKALTAIKLAAWLTNTGQGYFIPAFWLVSDDHDFREVNHVHIIDKDNNSRSLVYQPQNETECRPMFALLLETSIDNLLRELDELTFNTEFKENILEELRRCYTAGNTLSYAFGLWLTRLFRDFGLVLVEPADPRIKGVGAAVFSREIAGRSPSTEAVMMTSKRLTSMGYGEQIKLQMGKLNLFFLDGERKTLEYNDGVFTIKERRDKLTEKDLLDILKTSPQRFSPNVVLRPILQDFIFPTVAYVAGPGEIAYFGQLKGVYENFEVPMPIIYPRKTLTIVEKKVNLLLDRFKITVPDLWRDYQGSLNKVIRQNLPVSLEAEFRKASEDIENIWQNLETTIVSFEPNLKRTLRNFKGKIQHQMTILEKKLLQAYKKKNQIIQKQISKAKDNLFPNNHLQERQLNILPYLIKYGWNFIHQLHDKVDIFNFNHQLFYLD